MIKESIIAVIGGGTVAFAGYLLVVNENQVNIANIQRELIEIKTIGKENGKSLVATKLFIAQAHPGRDTSTLASLVKLKQLEDSEIQVLAGSLANVKVGPEPNNEILKLPVELKAIVKKYQLNGDDFAAYTAVANLPLKDDRM